MDEFAEKRRILWRGAIPLAIFVFGVMVYTELSAEGDPKARQVREAVYGDNPLGLPWLVVHSFVCFVICIPLPLCIVSTGEMLGAARVLGVRGLDWIFFPYRSYRAVVSVPEFRGLHRRLTLTWGWYFAWFAGWILLTSILGV